MTTSFLSSRALTLRFLPRATATAPYFSTLRVNQEKNAHHSASSFSCNADISAFRVSRRRSYATAAPASRPGKPKAKAHTGRATTSKRKTTASANTTSTAVENPTTSKKPAAKKKAAKAKVKPKRKTKTKPKPKVKPKPRTRVLTEEQLAKKEKRTATAKTTEYRKIALLTPASATQPKQLPATAWLVIVNEQTSKGANATDVSRGIAENYKNLALEERERINHIANENKAKNDIAFKKWVSSHTPLQIREANNARNQLRRQAKAAGKTTIYPHIQDDRLVKQPTNGYAFFLQDRVTSGDMKGMHVSEVGKLVGREWKALSVGDKKKYLDMQTAERNRYDLEYKTVYGVDPQVVIKGKKTP